MSLPTFLQIHLKTGQLDEINRLLGLEMNLRHPVALIMKTLDLDQQREIIGVIENFFVSNNISYKFPYPVYVVTDLDHSIANMPIVKTVSELPKFFHQKDTKMNLKEMHLAAKNKLIQQEVKNCDANNTEASVKSFASFHRRIHDLESERKYYLHLVNKLVKTRNG